MMIKLLWAVVIVGSVVALGANLNLSTEANVTTSGALESLGFKRLPAEPPGTIGGPSHFKVTKEALEALKKHEGELIRVKSDGSIKFVDKVSSKDDDQPTKEILKRNK